MNKDDRESCRVVDTLNIASYFEKAKNYECPDRGTTLVMVDQYAFAKASSEYSVLSVPGANVCTGLVVIEQSDSLDRGVAAMHLRSGMTLGIHDQQSLENRASKLWGQFQHFFDAKFDEGSELHAYFFGSRKVEGEKVNAEWVSFVLSDRLFYLACSSGRFSQINDFRANEVPHDVVVDAKTGEFILGRSEKEGLYRRMSASKMNVGLPFDL